MALAPGSEWASGNSIELRTRIARAMDGGPSDLSMLFEAAYLGDAAAKLVAGVASKANVADVMAALIVQCEADVRDKAKALLTMEDTASTKYRQIQFEARVAAGMLTFVNNLISAGIQAGEQINDQGDNHV